MFLSTHISPRVTLFAIKAYLLQKLTRETKRKHLTSYKDGFAKKRGYRDEKQKHANL